MFTKNDPMEYTGGDLKTRISEKEAEDDVKGVSYRRGLETKLFFLRRQLLHQLARGVW